MLTSKLDKSSSETFAVQVRRYIDDALASGTLSPGSKLPSESVLSTRFGVHRQTVHNIFRNLAGEGVLYSHPGRGWFIAGDVNAPLRIGMFLSDGRTLPSAQASIGKGSLKYVDSRKCSLSYITLDSFDSSRFDGVIWNVPTPELLGIAERISKRIPLVVNNRTLYGSDMHFVSINQYVGARDLLTRLANAGHRSIGCISIDDSQLYVKERERAFRDTVNAEGLDEKLCPILKVPREGMDFRQISGFLASHPQMSALFVAGEVMQESVIKACDNSGRDIAIVLYDDYKGSDGRVFPTVHQPVDFCLDIAIKQLCRLIAGEHIGSITIAPEVINVSAIKKYSFQV